MMSDFKAYIKLGLSLNMKSGISRAWWQTWESLVTRWHDKVEGRVGPYLCPITSGHHYLLNVVSTHLVRDHDYFGTFEILGLVHSLSLSCLNLNFVSDHVHNSLIQLLCFISKHKTVSLLEWDTAFQTSSDSQFNQSLCGNVTGVTGISH